MNRNTMSAPSITSCCFGDQLKHVRVLLICPAPQASDNAKAEIAFDLRARHIPGHFMSRRFNQGAA